MNGDPAGAMNGDPAGGGAADGGCADDGADGRAGPPSGCCSTVVLLSARRARTAQLGEQRRNGSQGIAPNPQTGPVRRVPLGSAAGTCARSGPTRPQAGCLLTAANPRQALRDGQPTSEHRASNERAAKRAAERAPGKAGRVASRTSSPVGWTGTPGSVDRADDDPPARLDPFRLALHAVQRV